MQKDAHLLSSRGGRHMLTTEELRVLAQASRGYGSFDGEQSSGPSDNPRVRDLALDALGRPGDDEVVSAAIALLADPDRNLRVVALRVLAWYRQRRDVIDALVAATHDPVRRVRRIALAIAPAEDAA